MPPLSHCSNVCQVHDAAWIRLLDQSDPVSCPEYGAFAAGEREQAGNLSWPQSSDCPWLRLRGRESADKGIHLEPEAARVGWARARIVRTMNGAQG